MHDAPFEPKPNDSLPSDDRRERHIATWILLGAGALVMAGGVGTALTLAARSPSAPTSAHPPPSALASAPASSTRQPSAAPRAHASSALAVPRPLAAAPRGPRTTAQDRTAALPVEPEMPIWGDTSALVTVVFFGDLDCPHTRRAMSALDHLADRFGADLRIAFRHRPVPGHATARQASVMAAALHAERGDPAFYSLVRDLARHPPPATPARFEAWARRAGEDPNRVPMWAASAPAGERVDRDLALAIRYGVRKTPTFFVNGNRLEGFKDEQGLSLVIEHGLAQALDALGQGAARPAVYARLTDRNFIGLGSVVPERSCPSLERAPVRGPADAPVTMVFFADFACRYCRKMVPILTELARVHGSDVRLVYKSLPHPDDPESVRLARFAEAAFARGGSEAFFQVHDALYAAGDKRLDDAELRGIARAAGLVPAQLLGPSQEDGLGASLEAVAKEAEALEVDGTPTLFVNGQRFDGLVGRAALLGRVEQELELGRRLGERGIPRARLHDVICPPPKPVEPEDDPED
jgi:protein-disulfide isomerase